MSESDSFTGVKIDFKAAREAYKAGKESQTAELVGYGLAMVIRAFIRFIWRILSFTGFWVPLIPFIIFAYSPIPGLPIVITLGLFFSVFWTGRNIYLAARSATSNKFLDGVFFGIDETVRRPAGKPIGQDGHVLVVGGAGTGKSSCVAIPTLKYFWKGTFLAVDIKGELAEKSERRAHIFNPSNPQTLGYDPFYLARNVDNPVSQIRDIALTLVPEPPNVKDPFWVKAAQNILTGHLLFSFQYEASFMQALKKLQSVPPDRLIEVCATNEQASMFVSQYSGIKSETLATIMSTLSNHIIPFMTDPDIENCLSKQEILTPNTLEYGNSVFLQIPEYKINQWKALITLIIQQFLTHFERRPEGKSHPILFLIDEFARFGKMEGILNGLATLRSKKITIEVIIQSLAQLDAIYGKEQRQIITDNCAYKAVLGATDSDTQKYFSALVGTQEVERESFTKDRKKTFFPDVVSSTISTVEKPIIRPEEFAYLQDIVLLTPHGFSRVRKQPYYAMKGMTPLE